MGKRGVLTEGDYRRSYRKTAQLNDFRFASGFGADARRKRHTADSGYGSEQPLDRRWSQEFNQEADHPHQNNAEDTRRIMLRAANCQRSPRSHQPLAPVASEPVLRGRSTTSATSTTPTNQQPPLNNPTPLTSTGSTASSTAS